MKKLIYKKLNIDVGAFFLISIISLATIVWIIQAVNYLDLISDDGHSLRIYFLYTFFSLPKIISKLMPFIFALSLFYTLLRYELNNEIIIYWMTGISKINLVNSIIKISFIYFLIQILLTSLVVPHSLDKGRSFFRSSDVDLFTSIIKKRKFIDSVEDLTIFVENKNDEILSNILIKERINNDETQIIIAQKGKIVNEEKKNKIILINGKIIDNNKNSQNIINFSEFNLDLSKYKSNTISHPKTQEMNSKNLLKCIKKLWENKNNKKKQTFFIGCDTRIKNSIIEEFLKRFFGPLFIILIGVSSSFMLVINKDQSNYKLKSSLVFCLSIFFIITSEITLRYSSLSFKNVLIYTIIPIISFFILYSLLMMKQMKN